MNAAAAEGETNPVLAGRDRWENVGRKPLATRGQGRVWRVRDAQDPEGDSFALKEMKYHKGPASTAYRRFDREVTTMSGLSASHPGIVPVLDHGIPREGD